MKKLSLYQILWGLGAFYFGAYVLMALLAGNWTIAAVRALPLMVLIYFLVKMSRGLGPVKMAGGFSRMKAGQAPQVALKLEQRRANGDTSLETVMTLSAAYAYMGRGDQAEPLAREALNTLQTDGIEFKQDQKSRYLTDAAYIALADAVCAQGRFQEAAQILVPRVDNGLRPVFIRTFQAWFYMLAGDMAQTLALLDEIPPSTREITPKYKFMLAYMRYKALDEDPRAGLRKYRGEMYKWDDDVARNANNPYGKRLREILDEIHILME
jgi:tetratricopeptide (TPR) repeat protein